MCQSCLQDSGGALVDYPSDDLGLADDLLRLQQFHLTGGALHSMVDDMNLEDHWFDDLGTDDLVEWHDWWDKNADDDCGRREECIELMASIRRKLATFTEAQRARICYEKWGQLY